MPYVYRQQENIWKNNYECACVYLKQLQLPRTKLKTIFLVCEIDGSGYFLFDNL